ncbi:unnamed protein product [Vitrella brassicaformis CCMP3155]|uniref:Uncharacterized protein n=1 Tax=Vitrella brassicaformis (strain CCMP3155) TaxID=1169540 RepID=A0A0G4GBV7_VITBC|nr:unnamed protein product [Vitrella brassicaformis CCMP3155]|eukprot:CEM26579.1 unnamed protein product [Vitrella brassicaformis CCMP3155]
MAHPNVGLTACQADIGVGHPLPHSKNFAQHWVTETLVGWRGENFKHDVTHLAIADGAHRVVALLVILYRYIIYEIPLPAPVKTFYKQGLLIEIRPFQSKDEAELFNEGRLYAAEKKMHRTALQQKSLWKKQLSRFLTVGGQEGWTTTHTSGK